MQGTLSTSSLKLLFYRYKDTVYYPIVNIGILFVIGIFLLFQVVIPQFSQWFSVQREVDAIKQNIKIMQENTAFLSSLDQQALESDVQTVTMAYPFDKDYTGIINALTQTGSKTGVAIPDFTISVGDAAAGDLPAKYQMALSFSASLDVAKRFISELDRVLPIAAVTSIENNGDITNTTVEFYYHGFPAITINQKEKLMPLTAKEQELLAKLKTWQVPIEDVSQNTEVVSEATSSGEFPPPL